jgi:hypothetical protein
MFASAGHVGRKKFQAPSSKLKAQKNLQEPSFKLQPTPSRVRVGTWGLKLGASFEL